MNPILQKVVTKTKNPPIRMKIVPPMRGHRTISSNGTTIRVDVASNVPATMSTYSRSDKLHHPPGIVWVGAIAKQTMRLIATANQPRQFAKRVTLGGDWGSMVKAFLRLQINFPRVAAIAPLSVCRQA
jgi:hypothetical protein